MKDDFLILTTHVSAFFHIFKKYALICGILFNRASVPPILDLFITLLSMGQVGLTKLMNTRETLLVKLKDGLSATLSEVNERILVCERNTISIAATLDTMMSFNAENNQNNVKDATKSTTFLGSMLFQRGVSGTRIVNKNDTKSINGHEFRGWGASTSNFKSIYFTAACSIGLEESEIDVFLRRLKKIFNEFKKKRNKKQQSHHINDQSEGEPHTTYMK